jgi:hypothetical protein
MFDSGFAESAGFWVESCTSVVELDEQEVAAVINVIVDSAIRI